MASFGKRFYEADIKNFGNCLGLIAVLKQETGSKKQDLEH
jgi:hypothetical protein